LTAHAIEIEKITKQIETIIVNLHNFIDNTVLQIRPPSGLPHSGPNSELVFKAQANYIDY